jgi:hypothetical protein
MTIEVITSHYEFAHGHKPRGTGYWLFYFNPKRQHEVFSHVGPYGEAKRAAIMEAKRRHEPEVFVCS